MVGGALCSLLVQRRRFTASTVLFRTNFEGSSRRHIRPEDEQGRRGGQIYASALFCGLIPGDKPMVYRGVYGGVNLGVAGVYRGVNRGIAGSKRWLTGG